MQNQVVCMFVLISQTRLSHELDGFEYFLIDETFHQFLLEDSEG